jgi:hypothetical protein
MASSVSGPGRVSGIAGAVRADFHAFLPHHMPHAPYTRRGRLSRVLLPIIFLNGALAHFEKGNLAYAALQ